MVLESSLGFSHGLCCGEAKFPACFLSVYLPIFLPAYKSTQTCIHLYINLHTHTFIHTPIDVHAHKHIQIPPKAHNSEKGYNHLNEGWRGEGMKSYGGPRVCYICSRIFDTLYTIL